MQHWILYGRMTVNGHRMMYSQPILRYYPCIFYDWEKKQNTCYELGEGWNHKTRSFSLSKYTTGGPQREVEPGTFSTWRNCYTLTLIFYILIRRKCYVNVSERIYLKSLVSLATHRIHYQKMKRHDVYYTGLSIT